jgi:hypothetical protein
LSLESKNFMLFACFPSSTFISIFFQPNFYNPDSASGGRSVPSSQGTPQTVEQGSSNANFRRFGDNAAKAAIASSAGAFTAATVGRVPFVGGPLAVATNSLIREQLKDVKIFSPDGDSNKNESKEVRQHLKCRFHFAWLKFTMLTSLLIFIGFVQD